MRLCVKLLILVCLLLPTTAYGVEQYVVPDVCRPLLERFGNSYGVPPNAKTLTQDQAFKAFVNLENHSGWPGVAQCLKAVNKTWRFK